MANFLSLITNLNLNASGFQIGMKRAESQASQFAANIKRQFAAAFGTAAITAMARDAIKFADGIGDLSKASGIAQGDLQKLGFAAKLSGATMEDMTGAIQKLARSQVDARDGNEELVKIFARYGVTLKDLQNLRPEDIFWKIAQRLDGVQVNAQMTADAFQLMGRSSDNVLPAMVDGLAKAAAQAERLKVILSDADLAQLQNLDDQMQIAKARSRPAVVGAMTSALSGMQAVHEWGLKHADNPLLSGAGGAFFRWLGKRSVEKDIEAMRDRPAIPSRSRLLEGSKEDSWETDARFRGVRARMSQIESLAATAERAAKGDNDRTQLNSWQKLGIGSVSDPDRGSAREIAKNTKETTEGIKNLTGAIKAKKETLF